MSLANVLRRGMRWRRKAAGVALVLAPLALAPAMPAAAQSITVNVGASNSVVVAPGAKLTVPIIIDLTSAGGLNIASLQAGMSWGSALTLDSLRVVPATGWTLLPNIGGSSLTFAAFNSIALPATAIVANAYFTASLVAGGTRVMLSPTGAGSDIGNDILPSIRARSLDVAVANTVKWGDVNDNGTVDIIDAQQITRFSAGLSVANLTVLLQRGDVTADGTVNIIDAQQIARFSVGLPASPRVGTDFVFVPATTSVTMTPSTPQGLLVGRSLQLIATPFAGGTDLTGLAPIAWSSNNAAATVNASGFVTAIAAGVATITATSGGFSAQVSVTVAAVPVAAVSVALSSPAIQVGTTTTATATTRDALNNVLLGRAVTFSSGNTGIATVNSSTGVVNGVAAGSTTIFATSEGITGSAPVFVTTGIPTASVTVVLGSGSIQVGATTTGTATARDAGNNVLAGKTFTWSSSNPSVATVNASTGLVTGVSGGSATIIATTDGVSGQAAITVTVAPVASVVVTLASSTVQTGFTTQGTAVLRDAANNVLTGRIVTWSSSNTAVATVNAATGVVSAIAAGTATIFATSEGITGQATVTASTQGALASVTANLNSTSVVVGATTQGTAILRDASNNILTGLTVTWSSTNTAVATVNSTTGLVTSVATGTANVVATSSGITGQRSLTVTAVPVATVNASLSPASITIGATSAGSAVTLDASSNVLTGRVVTWSSSNAAVATVNSSTGVVTGVAVGTATITATSESRTGTATITVALVPVNTVTVSLGASTIGVGSTTPATAVLRDASNNVLTGRTIVWTTSNAAVATVNSSTGVVTAVAIGTANIVATSETKTGQATVTVQAASGVGSSGGTVTATGGTAAVVIPSGALAASTAITVTTVASPQADPKLINNTAFDFGPNGTTFATPVTINITYPSSIQAGTTPSQYRLHKLIGTTWTPVSGSTVNTTTRVVTGQVSSFSTYAVLEAAANAALLTNNEPPGMTLISERQFNCTKQTACETDWEYIPTTFGGMTIEVDPTAPKSAGNVVRSTIPTDFPAGYANGKLLRFFGSEATPPSTPITTMYISVWVYLSSTFEGVASTNNKIFYLRWGPGSGGSYPSYASFEALGAGSDPVYAGMIFGNLAAPYADDFNNLDVTIKRSNRPGFADGASEITRATWHHFEFIATMNTPGVANGSWQFWHNGVKKQNLLNMMFRPAGSNYDWRFLELTPSWGGSGGNSTRSFFIQYDHIYISGK